MLETIAMGIINFYQIIINNIDIIEFILKLVTALFTVSCYEMLKDIRDNMEDK